VFEVRDLWPAVFVESGVMKKGLAYKVLEAMEKFFYRVAKRIIVVTRSFREDLTSRGFPEEKIGVIPNGADFETWTPGKPVFRDELGGEGKALFGFVGTHGVLTGLELILDAATILRDDPNIAFAFVGEGADKERLMNIARERGLTNVRFHDAVAKASVKDVYASLDACLVSLVPVPFFGKFIPSKIFEILASEKPIIAALSGEPAQILREAGNFVVAPGDAAAFAREIQRVAADRAGAAEAGRKGRAYVAEHFNRRDLARQYIRELVRVAK
ncbi:MAG TPA: glycosyltransferase family 4 protein, partial [Thermoanaerobaculia bacterium]|nr:glycosyltransferase family 4 protein [Thermoanaerobaculia bacterium]